LHWHFMLLRNDNCLTATGSQDSLPGAINGMENYVEVWALWLLQRQVIFNTLIADLTVLAGQTALRSGRVFDTSCVIQNAHNSRLWKVGVVGDTTLSEDDSVHTRNVRKKLKVQRGLLSKVQRYLLSFAQNRLNRIFGFAAGRVRHKLFTTNSCNPHTDTEWALVPGVNFLELDDGSYICADYGAIYEDYLTTDASRYPSQVGIDLYTSSNAAYLFKWMSERDSSNVWGDALSAAEVYFRTFYDTPRQRLEFDHREFDFTALYLAFGPSLARAFSGWTAYDPVNVFGLRWDNMAQVPEARSAARLAVVRWMVSHHQTADGLIRDNHLGRAVDAGDLTYHQYCLAGLALGNTVLEDAQVDLIIQRGLAYSTSLQLPNGEVSYYGRGANNIYHLAAYIAAMAVAADRYRWDVTAPLGAALTRLVSHLDKSALSDIAPPQPTAMNAAPLERMVGWHGSCAQYGAQSAFLLARAVPFLRRAATYKGPVLPVPASVPCLRPVHAWLQAGSGASRVMMTVTSGSECMRWNSGQHVSGFAGLTALFVGNQNRLLTNERVVQDDGRVILLADVPDQGEHDQGCLTLFNQSVRLTLSGRKDKRTFDYSVDAGCWSVSLSSPKNRARYCLGLQGAVELRDIQECGAALVFSDGFEIDVLASQPIHIETIPVLRSCHGTGVLLCFTADTDMLSLSFTLNEKIDDK
jgi:hypothetical protein